MRVLGLRWVGTRTQHHDQVVAFFHQLLGLPVRYREPDFTVLQLADGSTVEVFGPISDYNRHITCPVAGFAVDDLEEADRMLRAAGVEIVLAMQRGDTGAWLHFRAPDGHMYELSQDSKPALGPADRRLASRGWHELAQFEPRAEDGSPDAHPARRSPCARPARRSACARPRGDGYVGLRAVSCQSRAVRQ